MFRIFAMLGLLLPALTFFEKNAQRFTQWGRVRRGGGHTAAQFTLHTYEAPLGRTVLAAATYLLTRTGPGSYHRLFDAMRKHIQLAPWGSETWHSVPTNNWSVGASAVMYATDWRRLNAAAPGSTLWTYRQNLIYGFALAAADFSKWLVSQGRAPVPKRVLTRAQAMAKEAGFIFHRDTDPGRRTDPANPRDDFPWGEFFTEYDRLLGGTNTPTTSEEDDTMNHYVFNHGGNQYIFNPRNYTYTYVEAVPGEKHPGAKFKADRKTVVEATGDHLLNWRDRPNAGSDSDELAAVVHLGTYVGPEAARPKGA